MKPTNHYWKQLHQDAIITYITCISATTSATTRNYLFNYVLYQPLLTLTRYALANFNHKYVTDDNIQECLIFIYEKVLNKLDIKRVQAALQFIYFSVWRYIIKAILHKQKPENSPVEDYEELFINVNYDQVIEAEDKQTIKTAINKAIDDKIAQEKVINKRNTLLLINMKEYLINNEYDERGFCEYVMEKMNIKWRTYLVIASNLNIRTKLFNVDIESF